jgi:hypothetical protein
LRESRERDRGETRERELRNEIERDLGREVERDEGERAARRESGMGMIFPVKAKSFREKEGEEHGMDREEPEKRERRAAAARDYQREEKPEPSDMSRANEPRLFRSLQ